MKELMLTITARYFLMEERGMPAALHASPAMSTSERAEAGSLTNRMEIDIERGRASLDKTCSLIYSGDVASTPASSPSIVGMC